MNILVSACLLGVNCRYDGGHNYCAALEALKESHLSDPGLSGGVRRSDDSENPFRGPGRFCDIEGRKRRYRAVFPRRGIDDASGPLPRL